MLKFRIDLQRKYVFLVLAVLVFLALIYRFFPSFQELVFPAQEIALKEKRLIKYRKTVVAESNLDQRLASLQTALKELESRLLSGRTAALAAVEIQKIVQEILDRSHIQIKSVKVLNPLELDQKSYLSIPVEFHIFPTIRQLKEVLYCIENSPKCLRVKKLNVQHYASKQGLLRCDITIAGFMKREKI
jgi:translation initiation factor 1 (eIF-1/SUI1)